MSCPPVACPYLTDRQAFGRGADHEWPISYPLGEVLVKGKALPASVDRVAGARPLRDRI